MSSRQKAWLSWSSGKDSAYALHVARRSPTLEIVGLLTTVTVDFQRVSMHAVRRKLLEAQAERLGLPLHVVEIPAPCPNDLYAARMSDAIAAARAADVEVMIFGDIFLEDVRAYRLRMMEGVGIEAHFPLWGANPRELAAKIIDSGIRATLTCIDPRALPREFAGRSYDHALLSALPEQADPCGENGEFHSFVWSSPDFSSPIEVRAGEVVERDGFVFADLLPASTARGLPSSG
jgi:uncharacterized protein (TIGR00290 family)